MMAGVADWPTYLDLLAQSIAVGGLILFSLIGSWVFGREFVDRTVKDLLALPTARSAIVAAKFLVIAPGQWRWRPSSISSGWAWASPWTCRRLQSEIIRQGSVQDRASRPC